MSLKLLEILKESMSDGKAFSSFTDYAVSKAGTQNEVVMDDNGVGNDASDDYTTIVTEDGNESTKEKLKDTLTQDQKNEVIDILKKYKGQNVPDNIIHNLSTKFKIETDKLESFVYSLASKYVSKNNIK